MRGGEVTVEIIIIEITTIDAGMRNRGQGVGRGRRIIIIIIRVNIQGIGMRRKRANIVAHLIAHILQVVVQVRIGDAIEGGAEVVEIMVVLDADRHLRSIKKNVDMVTIGSKGALQIQGSKT
jgi:hypothetical protein